MSKQHHPINKNKQQKAIGKKAISKRNKQKETTKKAISKMQLSLSTGFPYYSLHTILDFTTQHFTT